MKFAALTLGILFGALVGPAVAGDYHHYRVPEPGTLALLSTGVLGLVGWTMLRRKRK